MPLLSKLLGRSGQVYEGAVVRAAVPRHPSAVGYFAVKDDRSADLRRPLRWVLDSEHERGGYFVEA